MVVTTGIGGAAYPSGRGVRQRLPDIRVLRADRVNFAQQVHIRPVETAHSVPASVIFAVRSAGTYQLLLCSCSFNGVRSSDRCAKNAVSCHGSATALLSQSHPASPPSGWSPNGVLDRVKDVREPRGRNCSHTSWYSTFRRSRSNAPHAVSTRAPAYDPLSFPRNADLSGEPTSFHCQRSRKPPGPFPSTSFSRSQNRQTGL